MYLDDNFILLLVYIIRRNICFVKVFVLELLEIFNFVYIFDICIVCGKKVIGEV